MTLEITSDPYYDTERAPEYRLLFTDEEWKDILEAASERGVIPFNLIREAVLSDLVR